MIAAEAIVELEISTEQCYEVELAPIIDEQELKDNYLPEKHLQEIAINFIAAGKIEVKDECVTPRNLIRNSLRGNDQRHISSTMAGDNEEVGLGLNCAHEINLKPGTKPVKQRVRRLRVN